MATKTAEKEATSFPGSCLLLEKVPWLRLVICLCILTQAAQRVGPRLNFVNTVYGGECCASTKTFMILKTKQVICQRSCLTSASSLPELL